MVRVVPYIASAGGSSEKNARGQRFFSQRRGKYSAEFR